MDLLKETAMLMVMVLYHWLVAIVKSILPASLQAKDISGETVLITGAGTQNYFYFLEKSLLSFRFLSWV